MSIDRDSLTGLILSGGLSSRMQGADALHPYAVGAVIDKGLLGLNGHPLVHHAVQCLAPQVGRVLISANRFQDRYAHYGPVVADDPALGASPGPLAGVEAALRRMATPWLLVMPVDVCAVPADMGARLAQAIADTGALMAYACTRGGDAAQASQPAHRGMGQACQPQPLCMLAHASLADGLRQYLLDGDRKVQRWQQCAGAAAVVFDGGDHAFLNINTPEDLVQASQYCRS